MKQSFEPGVYYAPGRKVLYYFSFNRILPIVVVFIVLEIGLNFLSGFFNLKQIVGVSSSVLIIVGIICCIVAFLSALINYKSVQFMFDEFAFRIKKGFLSKSEIAIPYRQIQSINHSQSFNQKMLGIMNIVIETAGENESKDKNNEDSVLPILDSNVALSVETELLKRSSNNTSNLSQQKTS